MIEALITAGVVNGGLIALILLYRGVAGRNAVAVLTGLSVLTAVVAVLLIRTGAPLRAFETALTLLAGVLVVMVVGRLVARPPRLLYVAASTLTACLAVGALDQFLGGDPVRLAVPAQIAFTGWAWILYARTPTRTHADRRLKAHRRVRLALMILIGATLLHVAQMLRLAMPDNPALRSIVPLTVGLVFIAATAVVAIRLISARDLAPLNPAPAGWEMKRGALLIRLRAHLDEGARYARPDVHLDGVSAELGLESGAITEGLQASGYGGWADYLRTVRVDHACAQLADPRESRTSIDAIGLGCGFRSRSTFYEAFERETGLAPGAWRRRARQEIVSG